jgi:X-X-X-Leu-X-X-Gly heptad repeat protein
MSAFRTASLTLLVLAGTVLSAPARAAEVDKYLPDDTNLVLTVHVDSLLDAPLVAKGMPVVLKRYGYDLMMATMGESPAARKALEDNRKAIQKMLGDRTAIEEILSQWKQHARQIVLAGNTDTANGFVIIVRGEFDKDDLDNVLWQASDFWGWELKSEDVDDHTVYQLTRPDTFETYFIAVTEAGVCVFSPEKDRVMYALAKADGTENTQLSKEMRTALSKVDDRQTIWMTAVNNHSTDVLRMSGGITVADDVKVEVVVKTRNAEAAEAEVSRLNEGLGQLKAGLDKLAKADAKLKPLATALKPIQASAQGSTVTLKARIDGEAFRKLLAG